MDARKASQLKPRPIDPLAYACELVGRFFYHFSHMELQLAADGFWRYRSGPGRSLRKAAGLFNEIRGETIIEVGSGLHGRLAGNSMLVWPKQTCARRIIAIDLDQDRINEVKAATASLNVELVVGDGIAYLDKFTSQIDLLYLDFWTSDPVGTIRGGTSRAEAYLKAYEAAKGKMSPHSLILMDDTDHVHPWKHTHIIPRARLDGYEVVYTGRQTLLRRSRNVGVTALHPRQCECVESIIMHYALRSYREISAKATPTEADALQRASIA